MRIQVLIVATVLFASASAAAAAPVDAPGLVAGASADVFEPAADTVIVLPALGAGIGAPLGVLAGTAFCVGVPIAAFTLYLQNAEGLAMFGMMIVLAPAIPLGGAAGAMLGAGLGGADALGVIVASGGAVVGFMAGAMAGAAIASDRVPIDRFIGGGVGGLLGTGVGAALAEFATPTIADLARYRPLEVSGSAGE